MSFQFNVEQTQTSSNSDSGKQVDWDALNKYLVDTVGTQKRAKSVIGIISGVIDLGLQVQEDAKMVFTGTPEDEAAELEKNPEQYFETLPDNKGVPTRYKRWKVKPCQQVAITVDFPTIMINKGQFFGDENAEEHPLRMILNGEFYLKDVGKVVGKPYNVKEHRHDDGFWAFKSNTQIHKLAAATDSLNDQGYFKANMLGNLLGKAALFEIQLSLNESNGKQYLNEKIKLSGQVPDVMVPMIPGLDPKYIYGVNFKGVQDPKILKNLRQSVINTMKLAQNYQGSDVQKALDSLANGPVKAQANAEQQEDELPQQSTPVKNEQPSFDPLDEDIPFAPIGIQEGKFFLHMI